MNISIRLSRASNFLYKNYYTLSQDWNCPENPRPCENYFPEFPYENTV